MRLGEAGPSGPASSRPRLLVVSGLPAAGKSTLARRLVADLDATLVWRDGMRRAGEPPATLDQRVRRAIETSLDAGETVVLDGNFNRPEHADSLRALVAARPTLSCFEVCLWGDADVLRARFIERADPPLSDDLRPYFEAVLARPRTPVLSNRPRRSSSSTPPTSPPSMRPIHRSSPESDACR